MSIFYEKRSNKETQLPKLISCYQKIKRTNPECCDCKINVYKLREYCYMILDHLWQQYCKDVANELICINCLEVRLGRKLNTFDFTTGIPINSLNLFQRSSRLLDRMTSF